MKVITAHGLGIQFDAQGDLPAADQVQEVVDLINSHLQGRSDVGSAQVLLHREDLQVSVEDRE